VRDTIFNNRVRFARLSELNDPFEGRPFMVPQFDDPKAQSAAVYASILEDVQKEGLSGEDTERQARFETTATLSPQVTQVMRQELLRQAFDEFFWIYSVSATRDPILMWSHYSDGHKGVVLHFDVRVLPFDRLFEVHYSDQYPEYAFPASASIAPEQAARAMLYAKANGWRYEREFRAIRVLAPNTSLQLAWRGMGVDWAGQVATLPEGALTGITLGAAMPPKTLSELHAELAERRPTLELWQATVNARSYALDFRRMR
jgi:hypothetical protein